MKLYNYGIQNEESDMRAHVSPANRTVYYFPTRAGVEVILKMSEKDIRTASQAGITTAKGFAVPIHKIQGMMEVEIPYEIIKASHFPNTSTWGYESKKGAAAVYIVKEMLKLGLLPVSISIKEITEENMQISGTDILVQSSVRIQVKSDIPAAKTGNLYLQIAELNPFKKH